MEEPIRENEIARWEEMPLVLTADEVSDLLRLDRETVYRALAAGGLPGRKVGRQWRIDRATLQGWWFSR